MLLIFALCFVFCACDESKISPWGDKTAQNGNKNPENVAVDKLTIYVCGAVQKEGYYQITKGDTYYAAISQAGLLLQSWISPRFASVVDAETLFVVVNYTENGLERNCINANSEFIAQRTTVNGLSDEVVNKLADYIDRHGAITNKTVLREVLGEQDFENYHYKLFVAEADYEAVD